MLQDCVPVVPLVVVHDTPPFTTVVVCTNVRNWLPVPHVAEHVPQLPHAPTQFTGHSGVLQSWGAVAPFAVEHATPPLARAVVTANVRC